jgi:hypothetical protein
MMVYCPGCGAILRVPTTASGRRARCPSCRKEFVVPPPEDMLEETVSAWIEQDVDKERQQRSTLSEQALTMKDAQTRPRRAGAGRAGLSEGGPKLWPMQAKTAPAAPALKQMSASPAPAAAPPIPPASPAPPAPAAPAIPAFAGAAALTALAAPDEGMPASLPEPQELPAGGGDGATAGFPAELIPRAFRPYLVVLACSQNGVRVLFDAHCLEHDGFRASLPMRDVFSRTVERGGLLARPMGFIDRSGATLRSVQAFDAKYEQTVMPGWQSGDLLHVMPTMDGLPRPFNLPVPYYVSGQHSQLSLSCQTTRRPDGGFTCEVLFPHGDYALEWLARVNGTCGPEYHLLAQELNLIHADMWNQLPEVCRQRIVVWCHFKMRERFVLFIPDAEFPQREMGLAGLVVTSQRLIYQKYHHSGEADLNEEAYLLTRVQEGFCHLTLQNADRRTRVVKIEQKDLPALTAALAQHPKIRIIASNEA